MTGIKLKRILPGMSAVRLTVAGVLLSGVCGVFGCLDHPIAPTGPRTTSTIVERLSQSGVDKIDLLLAIDNSGSMADKQKILAFAVPDLVKRFVTPDCVDPKGIAPRESGTDAECREGLEREFEPINDIHIGVISSSLGGHGSDTCATGGNPANDDKGHLLTRGNNVVTYKNEGFLAWDPTQKLDVNGKPNQADPDDGEADATNDSNKDLNSTALIPVLSEMVQGVGQSGCGFEAQLESVYRLLVDPNPYETISSLDGNRTVTPQGTDQALLTQRKDFLRPDSLLAVIVLSDENDCSIRDEGYFFFAARQSLGANVPFRLPRATSVCATNPNDKCCTSCGFALPAGCEDPVCAVDAAGNPPTLSAAEDPLNLRCFNQKRRFGIDFLYPIDRYRKGFSEATIADRDGNVVPNPIFSDLDPSDKNSNIRNPGLVFVAGIVGVPWQDIARQDANGAPNLLTGLDKDGNAVGGFKDSDELGVPVAGAGSTWDVILGNPATNTQPSDPHMIESITARAGTNPITGTALAGVDAPSNEADPINGHEYTVTEADLQYACVFALPDGSETECNGAGLSCDCSDPNNDKPLCDSGANGRSLQVNAKAYPGLRELQLIRDLGPQGIVGSVCPEQIDPGQISAPNYGYRPAVGAIVDRLKTALGGQCLPRTLQPDKNGQVACLILEARNSGGTPVDCAAYPGRQEVLAEHKQAKLAALADPIAKAAGWDSVCEVKQLADEALTACQDTPPTGTVTEGIDGWCYIDPTRTPPVGNPEIVAKCPKTERRLIRFVNKGEAQLGSTLFITCSGE